MGTMLASIPCWGGPGLMEIVIIGVVVLIFFGAAKLPRIGRGLGEGIRSFKTVFSGGEQEKHPAGVPNGPAVKKDE